jgi:hypothetical protein
MKKLLMIAAALTLASGPALAARVEFVGTFGVTSATSACGTTAGPGMTGLLRYWPRNLGSNGAHTRFTFLDLDRQGNVRAYDLTSGNIVGGTFKDVKVTSIKSTGGVASWTRGMRLSSQTPVSPVPTTASLAIRGIVLDYGKKTGCTVGFSANLTRDPTPQ